MVETELKLLVPDAARRAVERAMTAGGRARRLRLQAIYFDTADRRLAAAALSLRLRREGGRWVQTLKGRGDDALQRSEHDVALSGAVSPPPIDPARHAGTPAGERLSALLATDNAPLVESFGTDVQRRLRGARTSGGAVELAFDVGHLRAGAARAAIAELEVELLRGAPRVVIDVARRWVERHALVLDLRSKAERGDRLARGEPAAPPRKASPPALERAMNEREAFAAIVAACIEQVLGNCGAVIDGAHHAEHVHQLRVGLRRLRTALRLFEGLAPAGLDERVAALFRSLGGARDRDVIEADVLPALRAAGAPPITLPDADGDAAAATPTQTLRGREASLLWLDLLVLAQAPADAAAETAVPAPPLERLLGVRLDSLHRRVRRDARRFATLDVDARHRLRKRIKRLRYAIEFSAGLYRGKAVERYLAKLRPAQEALGVLNDLQVAGAVFERAAPHDPGAWFALGWLAARREAVLRECAQQLRALRDARPFWSA